jgi:hypothetical protein
VAARENPVSMIGVIGWAAAAVLVVGWLVVSFSEEGRRRAVIEWLSASAMYLALTMLFTNLISRAWQNGNHFALAAFGFLGVIFAAGLCVSLFNMLRTARGYTESGDLGATH